MPKPTVEREVIHPERRAVWYTADDPGPGPMTVEEAKKLLGWEEEPEGADWGRDYLLKDRRGKKVRCHNNRRNRPYYPSLTERHVQEYLNRRWRVNGEPWIVGRTGVTLNMQHRGTALVLAEQDRELATDADGNSLWGKLWPTPVTVETLVVFGIDEDDATVDTMDTCKPRSLADVIYRSPYFSGYGAGGPEARERASRITESAVNHLWVRTGVYLDAHARRRTHAEAIDFIERHRKLLQCVKHVMDVEKSATKDDGGDAGAGTGVARLSDYVPLGYAAAAMYLMASSGTDEKGLEKYAEAENPGDKHLDWSEFDRAKQFWTEFPTPAELREKVAALSADGGPGRLSEKDYLIARAWRGLPIELHHTKPDVRGVVRLLDPPTLGGIDLGFDRRDHGGGGGAVNGGEVAEVERRKAEVDAGKAKAVKADPHDPFAFLKKLHEQHPEVGPILCMNGIKKWVAWGADASLVGEVVDLTPRMHPRGVRCLVFAPGDEQETMEAAMHKAGYVLGYATEGDGGVWAMKVSKPKKGGKK